MPFLPEIVTGGVCLAVGVLLSCLWSRAQARRHERQQAAEADSILDRAKRDAEEIFRESKLKSAEEALLIDLIRTI